MLASLGLSEIEEACYRMLLEHQGATESEIAALLGMGRAALGGLLRELEAKGLVSRTPGPRPAYVPARPDIALESLRLTRRGQLDRVGAEIAALLDLYRRGKPKEIVQPVDLVTGEEAIRERWVQVQRSAHEEVRLFDKPPYVMSPGRPNPVEMELLERGIRYRIIYDATSFDVLGKLDAARACAERGEHGRVLDGLPMKLIIADRDMALTHDISEQVLEDAVIVHPHALLQALDHLFEVLWERAFPLPFASNDVASVDGPDQQDRAILALLAAGSNDSAIAHRLGIGIRTVRRRLAALEEATTTSTRFQLAIEAVRRDWI
ncbi:MAG: helix-turn-helix domain-containing protein [Actinomycetota bacterium]